MLTGGDITPYLEENRTNSERCCQTSDGKEKKSSLGWWRRKRKLEPSNVECRE